MKFEVYKKGNEVIVVFKGPEDAINVVTKVLEGVYGVKSTPVPALAPHPEEEDLPPAINNEEVIPLFLQKETEISDDDSEEEPPTELAKPLINEDSVVEDGPTVPEMEIKELRKLIFSHNKGKGNRVINAVFEKHKDEYESFGKFMYNVTEDVAKEIYIKLVEAGIIK